MATELKELTKIRKLLQKLVKLQYTLHYAKMGKDPTKEANVTG